MAWILKHIVRILLRLLMKRWQQDVSSRRHIEYRQGRGVLVLKDGIPADRKDWFYLPFLGEYSLEFQPPQEEGRKVYRETFQSGTVLEIVAGAEMVARAKVIERDYVNEVENVLKGPLVTI